MLWSQSPYLSEGVDFWSLKLRGGDDVDDVDVDDDDDDDDDDNLIIW